MEYTVEKTEIWINEQLKELQNMGMHIDVEASKCFYYHLWANDQIITGLNFPSKLKNPTLQSLLSVGYGSQRESSSESDGSSNGSSNDEDYDESNLEEWSQVFTKDGHFRLDQILPLLPPTPQLSNGHLCSFLRNLRCAKLALAHYNEKNKDAPYELVMPLMCSIFNTYAHLYYNHVNFFAKSKNADANSSPELFFAEVQACCGFDNDPVVWCCILKPNLRGYSSDPVKHFPSAWLFHPEDLTCRCTIINNCYFDSDDEL